MGYTKLFKACTELIDTIEATGGIVQIEPTGECVPVADEEWPDLARAYIAACEALGREPKVYNGV